MNDVERFMTKIRKTDSSCWEWIGGRDRDGYGIFSIHVPGKTRHKTVLAHRFAYQTFIGLIPDGLVIDHLCRNPACVNPTHLEPVSNRENLIRGIIARVGSFTVRRPNKTDGKTHCKHGHKYNAVNTYVDPRGFRDCRLCKSDRSRAIRARRRMAKNEAQRGTSPYKWQRPNQTI